MGNLRKEIPEKIFGNVLNDCIGKVEGTNDLDWEDIREKYNLEVARDVLRKGFYSPLGGYPIYKYMKDKMEDNINDNELLKEIENKKLELEKEKIRLQDQRREYKKYIRKDARWEHIVDTLKEEMERVNRDYPLRVNKIVSTGTNHAVLTCSDWHIGSKFKNYFEEYNIEIAKDRVRQLLEKTVEHCKFHNVDTLHVEILGDNIEGILHTQNKVESDEDVISQTMTVAEIFSEFISELAYFIPNVKVYHCIGNHARVNPNIKENMDKENFERIIPWYMKSRVKAANVEFIENEIGDDIAVYNVLNTKIVAMHGDKDKIHSVLNNTIKMLKVWPDVISLGHYHHHHEIEEFDCEVSVNGSLKGTDTYAKNIRKRGSAMQKLKIYNEDGQLCTYKIKFK
jgi:hypothetical protein